MFNIDKKVLITAGGTTEFIDDVRVMTNTSTGTLGSTIAERFAGPGCAEVFFVHGIHSKLPRTDILTSRAFKEHLYPVFSAQDAMDTMKKIIIEEDIDIVIHAMAVSDFTFKRDISTKCKSNDPQAFIDYMRDNITPNPKILGEIRKWKPRIFLVGFKYEVGIPYEDLILLAQNSIAKNGCDVVVANDKVEIEKTNCHVAHLVCSEALHGAGWNKVIRCNDKYDIGDTLCRICRYA